MSTSIVYNHRDVVDSAWLYIDKQVEITCTYNKLTGVVSIRGWNHRQESILLARFRMNGESTEGVLQL